MNDDPTVAVELDAARPGDKMPHACTFTVNQLHHLEHFVLLDRPPSAPLGNTDPIDDETAAELGPVSRLIHTFGAAETDAQCRILNSAHRAACSGSYRRSPFTLVPVVFACLCVWPCRASKAPPCIQSVLTTSKQASRASLSGETHVPTRVDVLQASDPANLCPRPSRRGCRGERAQAPQFRRHHRAAPHTSCPVACSNMPRSMHTNALR